MPRTLLAAVVSLLSGCSTWHYHAKFKPSEAEPDQVDVVVQVAHLYEDVAILVVRNEDTVPARVVWDDVATVWSDGRQRRVSLGREAGSTYQPVAPQLVSPGAYLVEPIVIPVGCIGEVKSSRLRAEAAAEKACAGWKDFRFNLVVPLDVGGRRYVAEAEVETGSVAVRAELSPALEELYWREMRDRLVVALLRG